MKETVKKLIPRPLRPLASRLYYFPVDTFERLTGRRDGLTPPRRLQYIYIGGGNFKRQGEKFLGFFKDAGCLKPGERVLDVGCGIGRMAIPLAGYLSREGSYEGFDVIPEGIRWCQKAVTSRFPNFRFQVADLHNSTYNPQGRYKAVEYRFPYADSSFDFAILTSVFTHMQPGEVEHYASELARVLAPEGRCFATFYLLNEESEGLIAGGKSDRAFEHSLPGCRVDNPEVPEDAVAYAEMEARALFRRHGFSVQDPIRYGKWCGRTEFTSYQDIIVAVREP
jgi:SAM-dependent methyltransferase